jgi:hypothetical protein
VLLVSTVEELTKGIGIAELTTYFGLVELAAFCELICKNKYLFEYMYS